MRQVLVLLMVALPFAAGAQAGTISPGMNRAQVVSALGEPATARVASEFTYLFYRNDCGKACGMNDLVVLRRDSVVDAIFRSPSRHYTGTSSSPAPVSRTAASSRGTRKAPAVKHAPAPPARTEAPASLRLKPSAPNDTHPSIPAGEPPVRKSPATAPATRPPAP